MTHSPKPFEILIAGLTPYFLERGVLWFQENFAKIKKASQTQIWWKTNTLFLEKDLAINLFALLRQLTELGYEKTQTIGVPGEFAHRGGLVEIFPINSDSAWRLEFIGNKISVIEPLAVKIWRTAKQIKKDLTGRQNASLLAGLRPGDYLVHLDHGVGRFAGFAQHPGDALSSATPDENSPAKYFVLDYAKSDKLFVPLDKEEKLSRYIGFEIPIVHRLGGVLWLKTKRRAKENSLELAKELLTLYGQRAASRGFQYPATSSWEKELAADFPYVETDDQARALDEVMRDMESPKPMDRLICGDVGFGKTEVALRAAFKAVEGGKQVAMLAPTTILANQHWHNFSSRLAKFPV
ncbi:DEAD/DEAH box helicase, partial [Patescibacteria group bacterium]|nr:DEAD/DEAH box helicase [Patescibacteria group bacterium]